MTEYRDLLPVIVEQEAAVLPDGCDSWAIESVYPDLRTRNGFRWAYPGGHSCSDDNLNHDNTSACPSQEGDGLCVATTWRGMASSSISARTLLLVAYQSGNILGRDDKRGVLRLRGPVHVVSLVDGEWLVREHGARAYLPWANLPWANLTRANLAGADLRWADLSGANLTDADLAGADLRWADLSGAILSWANLTGADLAGADLRWAGLSGANLTDTYPPGASGVKLPSGWALTDTGMAVQS